MAQVLCRAVWWFLTEVNTLFPHDHIPGYLLKGVENWCPHKLLHTDVYSSCIHSCQNLEATEMSFSKRTDKQTVVHPDNRIPVDAKKK